MGIARKTNTHCKTIRGRICVTGWSKSLAPKTLCFLSFDFCPVVLGIKARAPRVQGRCALARRLHHPWSSEP